MILKKKKDIKTFNISYKMRKKSYKKYDIKYDIILV